MNEAAAFTDGAARGNPGPGGWGAVVSTGGRVVEIGGGEAHTTNNKMELRAAIGALQNIGEDSEVTLFTDSSYLVNGITKWVFGWEKNGWLTKAKEPVLNVELWQELVSLARKRRVSWKRVPGHSGVPGNERANTIAEHFADKQAIDLFDGNAEDYSVDLADLNATETLSEKKKRSRGKAYSYVSLLDGKIEVHKTWDECKRRVEGKPAKFKKALSPEDEANIISEWTRA